MNNNKENNFKNIKINTNGYLIDGLLYSKENNNFKRLPKTLKTDESLLVVASHSSGGYIDFTTDSSSISVKVKSINKINLPHMALTGSIGLDLYYIEEDNFTFLGTTKVSEIEFTYTFIKNLPKTKKKFRIYFPLYIELEELELILDSNSSLIQENSIKPKIICYGTSITQGACASRSAMSYPAILGRLLPNYSVYNLGFSGNAMLRPEIANLIKEVENLEILVMEVEANVGMVDNLLTERLDSFIKTILDKNKELNIYLISRFPHSKTLFDKKLKQRLNKNLKHQKEIAKKYDKNIIFIDGNKLLKKFKSDHSVDLDHLNDLGFYEIAHSLGKIISKK